jgi:membrane-bound lytic murein transglycosylase D
MRTKTTRNYPTSLAKLIRLLTAMIYLPLMAAAAPNKLPLPSFAEFSADFLQQPDAQHHIRLLTTDWRSSTEVILGRAQYYFPIFEPYLTEAQLPTSLKYLAMVESELKPQVKSSHGASGLWQFMPVTARYYGLQIDGLVDERRDPIASTRAAVHLLADLYQKFRNWPLVLAAYNCGEGRVFKAIRRAKSRDFARVAVYLPRQTRKYISKFIASAWVGEAYEAYALQPQVPASLLEPITSWYGNRPFSFKDLSSRCGLSLRQLRHLNPSFLKDRIPFKEKGYALILPVASCELLKKSLGDTCITRLPNPTRTNRINSSRTTLAVNLGSHRPIAILYSVKKWIRAWNRV